MDLKNYCPKKELCGKLAARGFPNNTEKVYYEGFAEPRRFDPVTMQRLYALPVPNVSEMLEANLLNVPGKTGTPTLSLDVSFQFGFAGNAKNVGVRYVYREGWREVPLTFSSETVGDALAEMTLWRVENGHVSFK